MYWRAGLICLCLGAVPLAHASDVTTYGAGLSSCQAYTEARNQGTPDLVAYTDWLSGYLSGVNTTSNHRNNFLSHDDLESAMSWLGDFCLRHPASRVAEAAWTLILSAKSGPAAHAVEVAAYGAGYKSCQIYVLARSQRSIELNVDQTEFFAWLGGYLSGVNAMSLTTTDALGKSGLDDAVRWLDGYCGAHDESSFAAAVRTLIAPDRSADRKALAAAATPITR